MSSQNATKGLHYPFASARLGNVILFFVGVPHCSYELEQSTIIVAMNTMY